MSQSTRRRFALVSMPWFWAYLPSIQLAIVRDVLEGLGAESDVFEFYADLVKATGMHLYKAVANDSGYSGELVFSQCYFEGHDRRADPDRPSLGLGPPEIEQGLLDFLTPVVEEHLESWCAELDLDRYDAVCFSLTASQTSASMAMAKRIKARRPDLPIVFGGTSCAGEMGSAIAKVCREVDVVVHGEAEATLPALVEALAGERPWEEVPGITFRAGGELRSTPRAPLHMLGRRRGVLSFDSYFERIADNPPLQEHGAWVPFESSRGCWYGEKSQCTFCGLNEIIQYRERGSEGLLGELEEYAERYGAKRFFAVDLIMPRSFFQEFLPAVARKEKDWSIFYEIKSNLTRTEMERLAAGRVSWVQPGIESLDDDILRLMRKGVSAAQNIQTLKWAEELGIVASWNLITGFPRERAASYRAMAELFPKLHHIRPPVGLGDFEVHRFSPYFEAPEKHGIELLGAFPNYRTVYPIAPDALDDLVYRHAYRLIDPPDPGLNAARRAVSEAVTAWRAARKRGASFTFEEAARDFVRLVDSRGEGPPVTTEIRGHSARLLLFLDGMKPEVRLAAMFAECEPEAFAGLGGEMEIAAIIDAWAGAGIVLRKSGYVLGLPVRCVPNLQLEAERRSKTDGSEQTTVRDDGHDQRVAV